MNRPTAAPWFGRSNRRKRGLGVLCTVQTGRDGAEAAGSFGGGRVCARPPACGDWATSCRHGAERVAGGEARPLGSRKAEAWARHTCTRCVGRGCAVLASMAVVLTWRRRPRVIPCASRRGWQGQQRPRHVVGMIRAACTHCAPARSWPGIPGCVCKGEEGNRGKGRAFGRALTGRFSRGRGSADGAVARKAERVILSSCSCKAVCWCSR